MIAFMLALSGTASVVAYGAARRRKEIGLRVALGARGGAIMAVAGLTVGFTRSALASHSLASQLYNVSPFDLLTYLVVAGVLVGATLGASFVPAHRASTTDPVTALRYE